jgi:hypothetical protein
LVSEKPQILKVKIRKILEVEMRGARDSDYLSDATLLRVSRFTELLQGGSLPNTGDTPGRT